MEAWIVEHWFELLQTLILGGGLYATMKTVRADVRERKIQNLFALTSAHRDIWSALYDRSHLNRVLEPNLNLTANPVTSEEELFVNFLILHLRASLKARKMGLQFNDDSVAADIRDFFSHPIPQHVWENSKKYQDDDFITFVESNLK